MVMLPPLVLAAPFVVRLLAFPSPLTPVPLRWAARRVRVLGVAAAATGALLSARDLDLIGNSHNLTHVLVLVVYRELNQGIDALQSGTVRVALEESAGRRAHEIDIIIWSGPRSSIVAW